jgi:aminoglycoside 6'-N-acetyltransferase I
MIIREVRASDADVWKAMRCALWPDGAEEHRAEIVAFLAGDAHEPRAVFVAEDESGLLVGVAELSIRNDVAGIAGKRTGYAEGLYVVPERRGRGIARKLLHAAKLWARENQCEAFASDRTDRVIIDRRF